MLFTIPILVEERAGDREGLPAYTVRPLFHATPVRRSERLSRALSHLTNDLHELVRGLGKQLRHDELADWVFHPALEETMLPLRLELKSGSFQYRRLFAGYSALGRKLFFPVELPQLQFEVLPGQVLAERAAAVMTRHFRDREGDGITDQDDLKQAVKQRLTTLEITVTLDLVAKKSKAPTRAMIFGSTEEPDGETELRRTGRPLHQLYPDDLDRAVGRDREVTELARLLASNDRRPVVLVGRRKTGKTAIVHELAWQMAARKQERFGGNRQVWLVSPMRLISGMSYVGEWENRVLAILKHASAKDRVLYFDDLAGLFTAGVSSASNLNVAQVLKPALEKRKVRVVAEITPEAWRVLRERDRAFAELFQVIPVAEPTEPETLQVLITVARQLEERHRCEFMPEAVPVVYDLQRRFGGDAAFPGKAAGFLKRLAVRHEGDLVSRFLVEYEFQEQSGLHFSLIQQDDTLKRPQIMGALGSEVSGQDSALGAFADVLVKLQARLHDPRRPLGVFLLLGPTGVGKTQAAKALAGFLFSSDERLVRFDMNEFVDSHTAARLTGSAHEPEGLLTGAIRRQPFSVVLLDEIEKAAPEVFDLLLAVLDEGRLTDALGRVADFTHAIIILTSNLGAREAKSQLGFRTGDATDTDGVYLTAAEKFFRPEFFNRLDRVIPFRPLTPAHLEQIVQGLVNGVFQREGLRRRDLVMEFRPAAMNRLVELGHHPELGARALKRVVEREVAQPLGRRLAGLSPGAPALATLDAMEGKLTTSLAELRPVKPTATWGERLVTARTPAAEKEFLRTVLDGVDEFLDRIDAALDGQKPAGRIEVGKVAPEQARYFYCREQAGKVQRVAQAVARLLEPRPRTGGAVRSQRARVTKSFHQYQIKKPHTGLRAAEAMRFELADLETNEAAEVPDSPLPALLREAALLELIALPKVDSRPVWMELQAGDDESWAAGLLASFYQLGIGSLWGCTAKRLLGLKPVEAGLEIMMGNTRRLQGVWLEGPQVRLLLPAAGSKVLVRQADGKLGVVSLSYPEATTAQQADSYYRSLPVMSGRETNVASESCEYVHLVAQGKSIADLRSGAVAELEADHDSARAFLLSALPLPAELRI
jgi:ATP-dependent Clp protease ATP-binding subunit ClpC